ncbi:nucleoside-diphosphate kinase [bacterium]|nr:nucleoside-diphosphate kinase [bacterium]
MQKTVILLKPDCIEKSLAGEVIGRFEKAGLKIKACRMMRLTDNLLKEHYSHLADKPFFPEIVTFMQSTPVIAMALEGENAIGRVRDLLGPTDSQAAPKGSIRGDLGTDKMRNIAHASDSEDTAAAELKRFFAAGDIF